MLFILVSTFILDRALRNKLAEERAEARMRKNGMLEVKELHASLRGQCQ